MTPMMSLSSKSVLASQTITLDHATSPSSISVLSALRFSKFQPFISLGMLSGWLGYPFAAKGNKSEG